MRVLTAVCSHETQNVGALRTAYLMRRQDGDKYVDYWISRGDVAREGFVQAFLDDDEFGDEDAILLLDADQRHPRDLLERLRAHDLDMVCAHYYVRSTHPIQSLCYEIGDGRWPYLPYLHPPKEGLHEIAVTGFGCVLIKKKVFKAVLATLPEGMSPIAIGPLPEVCGDNGTWGPDFRFFHKARSLGYKLWLDASVESEHAVTVYMSHEVAERLLDLVDWADAAHKMFLIRLERYGMHLEAFKQRKIILKARMEGLEVQAKAAGAAGNREEWEALSIAVYQMQGKLMEMEAWIEWAEKYPAIERPDQLPTTENTPKQPEIAESDLTARQEAYRDNAVELASLLPEVKDGQA